MATPKLELVVCGVPGVGKSSFVRRLLQNQFLDEYVPQLESGVFSTKVDDYEVNLNIMDTPGNQDTWVKEVIHKDGFFFVFDLTKRATLTELAVLYDKVLSSHDLRDQTPCVLIGNKMDLRSEVNQGDAKDMARQWNAPYFEVCAKTGVKVKNATEVLVKRILKDRRLGPYASTSCCLYCVLL
eukprot:gb/GEZN01017761.1/.p1 GENE.gb/GEZN01017761.1/~~gb/GEZN01017761.1/.p1  ORF type:complete len:183 (+),score=23.19 gb/GEZN01017761.1/:140-688(+)